MNIKSNTSPTLAKVNARRLKLKDVGNQTIKSRTRVSILLVLTLVLVFITSSCQLGLLEFGSSVLFGRDSEAGIATPEETAPNDFWLYTPSESAVDTVQSALDNEAMSSVALKLEVENIWVSDEATEFAMRQYADTELGKIRGLTKQDVEDNMIGVLAKYRVEYDHEKTYKDDGEFTALFIVFRNEATNKWHIVDSAPSFDWPTS